MVKGSGTEETTNRPPEKLDPHGAQRPAASQIEVIQRFGDIDLNYALVRKQAWLAAQHRFEAAERRHAETLAALQEDVQTKLGQAYQQGVDAWDAGRSDNSRNQYQDLNRQYLAATGTVYNDARARLEESLRALNKEVDDVGKELNEVSRKAYRDYLISLQDAWRALDVDAVVEACTLAAAARHRM